MVVSTCQREIIQRWEDEKRLTSSPFGANDDWYWMAASVATAHGLRVVSNDLMRDHRLALLDQRPFLRWKTTQMIRFDLSHPHQLAAMNNSQWREPQVYLQETVPFSAEIQSSRTPDGNTTWHIPLKSSTLKREEGVEEGVTPDGCAMLCVLF